MFINSSPISCTLIYSQSPTFFNGTPASAFFIGLPIMLSCREKDTQNNPGAILHALEYYEYQVKHPNNKNNKFIDPLQSIGSEPDDADSEGLCWG